ncbi:MAG: DsrE family protein [Pyrinomonadaceae bacterium]
MTKKLTLALMDPPYESADSTTALRIISAALKKGIDVNVFAYEGAVCLRGVPPYTYSWSEPNTNSLSDRLIRNPVASPGATTSYSVSVRDSDGTTASDTVTVTVASSPPPTASFVFNVICCPTLNLDATASTGNIVSYTWDLEWTTTSPDLVTASPTASFMIQEFNRGTITLTVTDTAGRTATTTRNF